MVEGTESSLPVEDDLKKDNTNTNYGTQSEQNETKSRSSWTSKFILIALSYANFWGAACISLQAPFFPKEAEAKGATPTQYGFVFGVFELVVVIMSPVYGKLIPRITPKTLITAGVCLEGVSCAAFGLLDKVPYGTPYIACAFTVRILEGFGAAAFMTSSFTIIASEFPDTVATTFSLMETAFGFGLIVGPTIGGALYQAGGFLLPFVICGGFLIIGSTLLVFLLPTVEKVEKSPPRDLKAFLLNGRIIMYTLGIVTSLMFIGFNSATLEPHLRQFDLSPVILGVIFVITGAIYAFTTPIWGWICDKGTDPFILLIIGYILCCAAIPFLGPVPFLPFKAELWIVIVSISVIGLGLSAKLVGSFVGALKDTIARGFPDNLATYGMISALFASACSAGAFIGPSVGGFLLDTTGYEYGTIVIFAEELFFLLVLTVCLIVERRQKQNKANEKTPLLRQTSVMPKTSGYSMF